MKKIWNAEIKIEIGVVSTVSIDFETIISGTYEQYVNKYVWQFR